MLLSAAAPSPAPAQATVRRARLVADLAGGGGDAQVRVEYRLVPGGGPAAPARVEVLAFGPASVEGFLVDGAAGTPGEGAAAPAVPVPLATEAGSMRAGTLALPPADPRSGEVAVALVYRVAGAVERSGAGVRVRLPVLVLDLPPEPGGGPRFEASVRLPAGWSVSGGFPTGLAEGPDGAWEVRLPVVPSLVSLRGRSDGAWRPGLPEALDVLALAVLLAFGLVGWRHLRRVAA